MTTNPTQQQNLVSCCRILALLATDLETAQLPQATKNGLRLIAGELDGIAEDIANLEPEELPIRQVLEIHARRPAHPLIRS
jgi:hypothetical protein